MQIIVAFPKIENGKSIKNILVKHGFQVGAVCVTGDQTLQCADMLEEGVVVCTARLRDMMWRQLRECLPSSFEMIVLASGGLWEEMEQVTVLAMPLKVHELIEAAEAAVLSLEKRKKRRKFQPGGRSEEEKQILGKAKEILMKRKSMTEEEAHRYIQKCSMDSGRSLPETAQMILHMMGE